MREEMISAEKKTNIRKDMEEKSKSFPGFYSKYYEGVYGDRELQEVTTQPFWQSMRLTKRRLEAKGLQMNLSVKEHRDKKGLTGYSLNVTEDGSNFVGENRRNVVAERNYQLNGRKMRPLKDYEHMNIHMLHGIEDGENAVCPNCGHESKLSEFIDGCDFCGSQFTVKDFETKVSGFSLEENTQEKLKRTMNKTAYFLGTTTGILLVIGVICFIVLFALLANDNSGYEAVASLWGTLFAFDMVPVCLRCIIILGVMYLIWRSVLAYVYRSRIVGENIAKEVIADFSGEDFCQNLEYKLRNIHMTNDAKEVAAFAAFPLENIIEKYQDVVDCCVTRCKFIEVSDRGEAYEAKVQITMRLTLLKGRKIRTKYEKLLLTLSGRKEVVHKKEMALREYKCEGCHFSVNILEGSSCKYCGMELDYSKYGWVIKDYVVESKPANIHALASSTLIVIYLMIFASHLVYVNTDTENDNWLSLYKLVWKSYAEFLEMCESVPMPDVVDADIEQTDSKLHNDTLINTYESEGAEEVVMEYMPVLLEDGFSFFGEKVEKDCYVFYKKVEIQGDEGYLLTAILVEGDEITVAVFGDDDYAQTKSDIEIKLAP